MKTLIFILGLFFITVTGYGQTMKQDEQSVKEACSVKSQVISQMGGNSKIFNKNCLAQEFASEHRLQNILIREDIPQEIWEKGYKLGIIENHSFLVMEDVIYGYLSQRQYYEGY